MANHPDHMPGDTDEVLAARLTEPTDPLPDDPGAQVADPRFAFALRGYDRAAVDAYVERVARLVSELNASRSPREAVRQALERVGDETKNILRGAHDAAEHATGTARAEAEEVRTRAQADAEALTSQSRAAAERLGTESREQADRLSTESREQADRLTAESRAAAEALERSSREEAHARVEAAERQAETILAGIEQRLAELDGEVDAVWQERQRLIEDVHRLSGDLGTLAREAELRFPAEPLPETEVLADPDADATVEIPAAELPDAEAERP